jgi:hypothetical protein
MPPRDVMLALIPSMRNGMAWDSHRDRDHGINALGTCHRNNRTTNATVAMTSVTWIQVVDGAADEWSDRRPALPLRRQATWFNLPDFGLHPVVASGAFSPWRMTTIPERPPVFIQVRNAAARSAPCHRPASSDADGASGLAGLQRDVFQSRWSGHSRSRAPRTPYLELRSGGRPYAVPPRTHPLRGCGMPCLQPGIRFTWYCGSKPPIGATSATRARSWGSSRYQSCKGRAAGLYLRTGPPGCWKTLRLWHGP